MKFSTVLTSAFCATTIVLALPPSDPSNIHTQVHRSPNRDNYDASLSDHLGANFNLLEKRRGGGGGRGGGGSSGGRSGGGSSSSGRPASSYSFSPQSNLGGRTRDGSGQPPSYGGRYTGGAFVPYTAGSASPTRSVMPFLLPATALAFFPGVWFHPAYAYPFSGYSGYHWYANGRNYTANVTCLCQEYSVCGCDPIDPNNASSVNALAQQLTNGTGSGAPVNTTTVRIVDFGADNTTAYINGTLENGTTASGGTDPSNESQISGAAALAINYGGYWVTALVASLFVTVA